MVRQEKEIRFHGRRYPVLESIRLGDTTYLILERLGSTPRPAFRVLEENAVRQMRCLHWLPNSRATMERIRLLSHASLPHANLPIIIKSRRHRDKIAVITKWIDGPSLDNYLRDCRNGREPWPSAVIVVNLIRGLAHTCQLLHERLGLVHGDIHPGNVMLCRHSKRLVPIDFGSAWHIEHTRIRRRGDGAAPAYAAPELDSDSGQPGVRSDQFSVMLLGYEMLTGKLAYDGLGGKAANWGSVKGSELDFIRPSQILKRPDYLPSNLRTILDEVFSRSLQLAPADRYPGGREWIEAVHRLADTARTGSGVPRSHSWVIKQLQRVQTVWNRWST